jgi:hypothetical protein
MLALAVGEASESYCKADEHRERRVPADDNFWKEIERDRKLICDLLASAAATRESILQSQACIAESLAEIRSADQTFHQVDRPRP